MARSDASPTVERLAQQLEGDIRRRGLQAGDRYLTAAEASRVFDVGSMKVHRAMQALAGRAVLVRQRSRGTFVGPGFRPDPHVGHDFDVLHLAMAKDFHRVYAYTSDFVAEELSQHLPGATVQVHHLVEGAADSYVRRVIERIGGSKREAFVLIRCARGVQQAVSDAGLPAVVYGHPYPGVCLPSVQHDQATVGRLLAERALKLGARRFALLMHARWRYGDHKMIDAATAVLSSAGVALSALRIRSVPPDAEVVEHVIQEILQDEEAPDAFLCRSDLYAAIAARVVEQRPDAARRPLVLSGGHSASDSEQVLSGGAPGYRRIVAQMSLSEQIGSVARLLLARARGEAPLDSQLIVPVHFAAEGGP
jgi:DNA-binding transcriptional regulator YhcF (GntR family)